MYFGVDYYPEHWDIDMIDEDLTRMKEMGVNIVRIGEFAWHLMEPKDGEYDFSFFDMVIKKAKENNIKVMFGTPTATFPAWLANEHQDILSEEIDGNKRIFGGRRQYCYTSSTYRDYSRKISKKLVTHYKDEETIISWQVDNEFGHERSDMCYCDKCHIDFQNFLKNKYQNIDELNEKYGTIFWGQTYNNFDEIPIPKTTITTHNPALRLDWSRYRSFTLNRYAIEQIDIVKANKGTHQQVTTNASGGFFNKYFDHDEQFKELDFASYDNYPVWGGLVEPMPPEEIAMTLDFIRGLKDDNFWIVEQLMGAQGHDVIGYLPRPNQAKMWAHQGMAHGCNSMIWFRWRGMTRGAEQFCFGIIDHDNTNGRKYREVQEFIKYMKPHEEIVNSKIKSDVAILYSYDNVWSWRIQKQSSTYNFNDELVKLYRPFYRKNLNIDVIPASRDISKYKVVLIPNLMIADTKLKARLDKFLEDGGRVVFTYRAGIRDTYNNINFKETIPCSLREMVGARVEEIESLGEGISAEVSYNNEKFKAKVWRDLLKVETANELVGYNDFYKDYSCATENEYKNGKVYYIGSSLDDKLMNLLSDRIIEGLNLDVIDSPENLEIYKRILNNKDYFFISNHSGEEIEFNGKIFNPYEIKVEKRLC
ncbi:beta-galactosidase [Psychrilyobacter sp.]|uniref:beta-galactosidase n=1 Tax=Psychrilyobacter sp. TaxID=2586924 RepID=UPI00301AB49A